MFNFIDKLRMKSDTYKRGVAFSTSFVVTLSILFVWATIKFPNAIPGGEVFADRNDSRDLATSNEVRSAGFASALFANDTSAGSSDSKTKTKTDTTYELSRTTEKQGTFASFKQNTALSFAAIKGQLDFIGKYIGETKYEAEDGEVEVVPSSNSTSNSVTNRGDSVIY